MKTSLFLRPMRGECLIRPGVTNSVWGKIIFVSRDIFCQGSFADIKVVEFVMKPWRRFYRISGMDFR